MMLSPTHAQKQTRYMGVAEGELKELALCYEGSGISRVYSHFILGTAILGTTARVASIASILARR
jgi:hypothetical protein